MTVAGLAAGGAAASGFDLLAAEPSENAPEREVAAVISRYGRSLGKVRKSGGAVEFTVRTHSPRAFAKVFDPARLPFERIHVGHGNQLTFTHGGVDFAIAHVR